MPKQSIDWGKLVSQGRAKAPGVSWSLDEQKARYVLKIPAEYVRKGVITLEQYKQAQTKPGAVNPYLKLSKEDLFKKAKALGLAVSPEATREMLAQIILDKKQELIVAAKAKKEAEEKAKEQMKNQKKAEKSVVKKPVKAKPKTKPKKK